MNETGENRAVVLTPPGTGAIAVVRVAGPDALAIVAAVFRPAATSKPIIESFFKDGRVRYGRAVMDDETIDDVVVSRADIGGGPTYDICAHGGVRIVERILSAVEQFGASLEHSSFDSATIPSAVDLIRPAPTLLEWEILRALTRSKNPSAVRFLGRQLESLPQHVERTAAMCHDHPDAAQSQLRALLEEAPSARRLIDGVTVAIVGPPNSGKSTLFNKLAGRSAAIVSSEAGTTRDWVSLEVEIEGFPITLIDTAGRHAGAGDLEARAIEQGIAASDRADAHIIVVDGSVAPASSASAWLQEHAHGDRRVLAINKADVGSAWDNAVIEKVLAGCDISPVLRLSAESGEGVEAVIRQVLRALELEQTVQERLSLFTERQIAVGSGILAEFSGCFADASSPIIKQLVGS